MKRALVCLFSFVFIFSVPDRRIQYFLTEHDFLSNNPSPEITVTGRSHYRVEYDSNGRLLTKSSIDERKKVLTVEEYNYDDSTGVLREKNIFNHNKKLLSRTIFHQEENSLKFLKYLYNLDSVKAFGDRFTHSKFQDEEKPTVHEFFDVNGFNYGKMGFFYDSSGSMSSQVWIHMPSERVIRSWKYIPILGTDITRMMEYDSLGVLLKDMKLNSRGREDIFTFTAPENFGFVNHSGISYIVEGNLESGEIIWIEEDTVENRIDSTRINHLQGEMLSPGAYNILPPSPLTDGHVYQIIFRGKTKHGNVAIQKVIREVTYDISAPQITLLMDLRISRPEVAYTSSEPLESAIFKWLPGFLNDSIASIEVQFSERDLKKSGKGKFIPENNPDIVDNVMYDVSMTGIDRAGNMSKTAIVFGILCDKTPPINVISPVEGAFVNEMIIHYSLNEDLSEGSFTVEGTDGAETDKFPSVISIPDSLLILGEHYFDLGESVFFSNSNVYSVTIFCKDLFGYDSNKPTIDSIHFDISPPILSLDYPNEGSFLNNYIYSYSSNESLSSAEMKWVNTGGATDSFSPHILNLGREKLTAGDSTQFIFDSTLTLVDSAQYKLTFTGYDLALNKSDSVHIEDITFDISSPVFSNVLPQSNSYINAVGLFYSVSEELKKGAVHFIQVDGKSDSQSPHLLTLSEEMLSNGRHDAVSFNNYGFLSDSSNYRVELSGDDLAGNSANILELFNVTFDISSPIISDVIPEEKSFVKSDSFEFSISEDLMVGSYALMNMQGDTVAFSDFGDELLTIGPHIGSISFDSGIVDGTLNNLVITAMDSAGNVRVASQDSITFDFTAPKISLSIDPYLKKPQIRFDVSEYVGSATLIWTPDSLLTGFADTILVKFSEEDLRFAGADQFVPAGMKKIENGGLVDSTIYSVTIEGVDKAGNISVPLRIPNVHFDISKPILAINPPEKNLYLEKVEIKYSTNERLSACTIDILSDAMEPLHHINLADKFLERGEHFIDLVNFYLFEDVLNYHINLSGIDLAGNISNIASVEGIYFDSIPAKVKLISPIEEEFINNTKVCYFLNETLKSGEFIWEQTGGPTDPSAPHLVPLINDELTKGEKVYITLANSPVLRDSAIYTLRFTAVDLAGNDLDSIIVSNITFDITSPQFYEVLPRDSTRFNSLISYTVSESLQRGSLLWYLPEQDTAVFYSMKLNSEELIKGVHEIKVSKRFLFIEENKNYLIEFTGIDYAGNQAEVYPVLQVVYDITPPEITEVFPETNSLTNSGEISFTINEELRAGSVSWIYGRRKEFIIELGRRHLTAGTHTLGSLPKNVLIERKNNLLIISGTDLAGNISKIERKKIEYDGTPPEFEVKYPTTNSAINIFEFAYNISEELKEGKFICTQTEGMFDEQSPRLIQLLGYELRKSQKSKKLPMNNIILNSGSVYEIQFEGVDLAGNLSQSTVVSGVLFDNEKPEIIILAPANNEIVYGTGISYSLSEDLSGGKIIWERKDKKYGILNPIGFILSFFNFLISNSKKIDMIEEELASGDHFKIVLHNQSELKTGEIYSLTIQGVDRAGNIGNSAIIQEVQLLDFYK